jgi:hypothetical protein
MDRVWRSKISSHHGRRPRWCPSIYWLHRRWPIPGHRRNRRDPYRWRSCRSASPIPLGMAALQAPVVRRHSSANRLQLSADPRPARSTSSPRTSSPTLMLSGGVRRRCVTTCSVGGRLRRWPPKHRRAAAGAGRYRSASARALRGAPSSGREIMVEVAEIDWIEAAGNYAVLHVGDETLEIRSSLTKLENELDPKRFVQRAQISSGQHRAGGRGDALGERRLAYPPAGRRRSEPEPALSPAFRGAGARQGLTRREAGSLTDLRSH